MSDGSFYDKLRSIKGFILLKNSKEKISFFDKDSDNIITIWFEPGWETQIVLDSNTI